MRSGSCGVSPSGRTSPKSSTSRPSCSGSRRPGGPFPATGGSSPGRAEAPTSASVWGRWGIGGRERRSSRLLPRFLEHLRDVGLLAGSSELGRFAAPRWLAQDGRRRHDTGRRAGAPRRRRCRSRESGAGRGDRPGDGQRPLCGRSAAGRARASRRALSGRAGGRPSAVPPDHGGGAGVAGRPTSGRRHGGPAAHDAGTERRHRRWLVRLLERVARRCTPQSAPVRRGGADPTGGADDRAHLHGAVVRCRVRGDAGVCAELARRPRSGLRGEETDAPDDRTQWEVSRCQTRADRHRLRTNGSAPRQENRRTQQEDQHERRRRSSRRRAAMR